MSPTSALRLYGPSTLPAEPPMGRLELHIRASLQALIDRDGTGVHGTTELHTR